MWRRRPSRARSSPTWSARSARPAIISRSAATMPPVRAGDLLAIMSAGAYGAVQSGTYNTRPLGAGGAGVGHASRGRAAATKRRGDHRARPRAGVVGLGAASALTRPCDAGRGCARESARHGRLLHAPNGPVRPVRPLRPDVSPHAPARPARPVRARRAALGSGVARYRRRARRRSALPFARLVRPAARPAAVGAHRGAPALRGACRLGRLARRSAGAAEKSRSTAAAPRSDVSIATPASRIARPAPSTTRSPMRPIRRRPRSGGCIRRAPRRRSPGRPRCRSAAGARAVRPLRRARCGAARGSRRRPSPPATNASRGLPRPSTGADRRCAARAGIRVDAWIDPPAYTGKPPIVLGEGHRRARSLRRWVPPSSCGPPTLQRVSVITEGKHRAETESRTAPRSIRKARPAKRFVLRGDGKLIIDGTASGRTVYRDHRHSRQAADRRTDEHAEGERARLADLQLSAERRLRRDRRRGAIQRARDRWQADDGPHARCAAASRARASCRPKRSGDASTTADLSEHPWAGARATVVLHAQDEGGNEGVSQPETMHASATALHEAAGARARRAASLARARSRSSRACRVGARRPDDRARRFSARRRRSISACASPRSGSTRRAPIPRCSKSPTISGRWRCRSRTATCPKPSAICGRRRRTFATLWRAARRTKRSAS